VLQNQNISLVLASRSESRASILKGAGLEFDIVPADVDEPAIRAVMQKSEPNPDPGDIAEILARTKAEAVSAERKQSVVIGADQILVFEGRIYEKPADISAARRMLLELKGNRHQLYTSVSVARNGQSIWAYGVTTNMTMWPFTPELLGQYLADAGESVLKSIGAYQIESSGIQLFSKIDGDYFSVLGLPLLPLLEFLRGEDVLPK
jgi:septum formation protein